MSADDVLAGWCSACGQELLLDKVSGDCWHPYTVTEPCPPTRFNIGSEVFYSNRPNKKYWLSTRPTPAVDLVSTLCEHAATTYTCRPKVFHQDRFCHAHPSHDWPCPHAS